jgi:hypothetical protein
MVKPKKMLSTLLVLFAGALFLLSLWTCSSPMMYEQNEITSRPKADETQDSVGPRGGGGP